MTKIAARRTIVKHLQKRGHIVNFEVTPSLVMYWWNLLNKAIFDSKLLPPRKIVVRNFRYDFGWCQPLARKGHVYLGISSSFQDKKEFLTILAHEMVHQWQWTIDRNMTHGQTFFEWAPLLKRVFNLPLYETY